MKNRLSDVTQALLRDGRFKPHFRWKWLFLPWYYGRLHRWWQTVRYLRSWRRHEREVDKAYAEFERKRMLREQDGFVDKLMPPLYRKQPLTQAEFDSICRPDLS